MSYRTAKLLRAPIEHLIRRRDPQRVFEPTSFDWVSEVERSATQIRAEAQSLLARRDDIVAFSDVLPGQRAMVQGNQWKSFFLVGMCQPIEPHQALCPATTAALARIPGLLNALFSILEPGTHIPPHRGPYAGILRYHMGVIIPEGDCAIRVSDQVLSWREGESLIFDDSFEHEAWNRTQHPRVVLFVDFERPLPALLAALNRALISVFARSEAAKTAERVVRSTTLPGSSSSA